MKIKRHIKSSKSAPRFKKEEFKKQLQDELYNAFIELARTPEWGFEDIGEIDDLLMPIIEIEDYTDENGYGLRVEFRGELDYDGLDKTCQVLDKVVQKYDKSAYFEPVQPGIAEAFIDTSADMNYSVNASNNTKTRVVYITHYGAFDNGHVLHDSKRMTEKEAQEAARQASIKDPTDAYYVHYGDDWMNTTSGIVWVDGVPYHERDVRPYGNGIIIEEGAEPLDMGIYSATNLYDIDGESYEFITNVDGYWVYRAIVHGKGLWRAMPQGSDESQFDSLSFPISYDQARGFEPIDEPSAITKLRKDLGKKLLPKAGQSVEATEDLGVIESSTQNMKENVTSGTVTDKVYWYFTRHGVQPGSIPRSIDTIYDVIDTPEGTYFATNTILNTKELYQYEIKEKWLPDELKDQTDYFDHNKIVSATNYDQEYEDDFDDFDDFDDDDDDEYISHDKFVKLLVDKFGFSLAAAHIVANWYENEDILDDYEDADELLNYISKDIYDMLDAATDEEEYNTVAPYIVNGFTSIHASEEDGEDLPMVDMNIYSATNIGNKYCTKFKIKAYTFDESEDGWGEDVEDILSAAFARAKKTDV